MVLVMLSGQVQSLCGLVSAEGLIEAWQEGVVLRTLSDSFTVVEGQYFEYFPILCDGWRVERSVSWYLSGGTNFIITFLHSRPSQNYHLFYIANFDLLSPIVYSLSFLMKSLSQISGYPMTIIPFIYLYALSARPLYPLHF